jgi:hypothetical protein
MQDFWNGALTIALALVVVTILGCLLGLARGGDQ